PDRREAGRRRIGREDPCESRSCRRSLRRTPTPDSQAPTRCAAGDQQGKEDEPHRSPHLVLPVRVCLRHSITRARSVARKYVESLKPRTRPIKTQRLRTRLLWVITNAGKA